MRRTRRLPPRSPQPPDSSDVANPTQPDSAQDVPELMRVPSPSRVSIRKRLPVISLHINRGWLIGVLALVVFGIGAFLAQRNALPRVVVLWWPLVAIAMAGFVLIRSLGRRAGNTLLLSAALFGFGISLLLATA